MIAAQRAGVRRRRRRRVATQSVAHDGPSSYQHRRRCDSRKHTTMLDRQSPHHERVMHPPLMASFGAATTTDDMTMRGWSKGIAERDAILSQLHSHPAHIGIWDGSSSRAGSRVVTPSSRDSRSTATISEPACHLCYIYPVFDV